MNSPLLQQNSKRQTSPSIERHKAIQHGVAFLIYAAFAGCILLFGLFWGDIVLDESATVGTATSMVANLPLVLAAIDLVAAGYHFIRFKALHRQSPDKTILSLNIWKDLEIDQRSPVKVAVVLSTIMVLMAGFVAFISI